MPTTLVRYTGVSGKPLPTSSAGVKVHSFKTVPRQPLSRAPPRILRRMCIASEGQQVPLIEGGRPALGPEIEPVLRHGWAVGAAVLIGASSCYPSAGSFPCSHSAPTRLCQARAANALASSMDFEYVYCSVAVRPLLRRRRNWI